MIVFFQFEIVNDNLIKYRYYSHKLDEELQKKFQEHIYFYNLSSSKFILLLRKGVYPYGYMDDWEKFNEATLPARKQELHSNVNKEDLRQKVCKDSETKILAEYHDMHLKSDVLLLVHIFETCI